MHNYSLTVINPGHSQIHSLPAGCMFSWGWAKTIKKKGYLYLSNCTEKRDERNTNFWFGSKSVFKVFNAQIFHLFPIINTMFLTRSRKLQLSALVTHVPDVYLDAGPHPHQSRLSACRSLADIIGFDHSRVCQTLAKVRKLLTWSAFAVKCSPSQAFLYSICVFLFFYFLRNSFYLWED